MLGAPGTQKYVVCNADEGDPGTFSDRMLMEGDPRVDRRHEYIAGPPGQLATSICAGSNFRLLALQAHCRARAAEYSDRMSKAAAFELKCAWGRCLHLRRKLAAGI